MKKLLAVIGDCHIGKRFPYTNKKTSERWNNLVNETLLDIQELEGFKVQVGDLLDEYEVPSTTFVRAHRFARNLDVVLSGNHDVSKNTEKPSALHLLNDLLPASSTVYKHPSPVYVTSGSGMSKNVDVVGYAVPHQHTQAEFESALDDAIARVSDTKSTDVSGLPIFLHCNFGNPKEGSDDNYLCKQKAQELLDAGFGHIFVGHEHNSSQPLAGVTMVGSILPVNFGEMTDKYVWYTDGTRKLVWSADTHYKVCTPQQFLDLAIDAFDLQFIEVTGEVSVAESLLIAKQIANWYLNSETIIAIKNSSTVIKAVVTETGEKVSALDWIAVVSADLNPLEKELLQEILGELQCK